MIVMIIFIIIITMIIIIQTYANTIIGYQLPPTWKVIYFYNLVQVPAGDMFLSDWTAAFRKQELWLC